MKKSIEAEELCGHLMFGLKRTGIELTEREWATVSCVFMGLSRLDSAKALNVQIHIIKQTLTSVFKKANVSNVMYLVAISYENSKLFSQKETQ